MRSLCLLGILLAQQSWRDLRPSSSGEPLPSAEKPRQADPVPIRPIWKPSPSAAHLYERVVEQNRSASTLPGYRIQVFATSIRAEADSMRFYLLENYTDISVYMLYEPPIYKLRLGDFLNRKEAEQWLERCKRKFPGAFIVPDKVMRP